ncbi:hypothetical protein CYMTET_47842 [Cymbomonas tetramitiformis]|uniref:PiggyBac transposable element-derived protein domain-containing protein n=1 Tax=Cymbomonas tetramitiformis TaxID=36881 RepID=A0AAE0EXB8_9CHLO|nr:hypothetical protein CYMTET_47842 [Cymbomonas tetramitiformis]
MVTAEELTGRRVRTPGIAFGKRFKRKVFRGYVKDPDNKRTNAVTVRYDDGDCYWFPIETVVRWLVGIGDESDISEDLSDESDPEEGTDEEAVEESGSKPPRMAPNKRKTNSAETEEDRSVRISAKKYQESTAASIGAGFRKNARMAAASDASDAEFECKAPRHSFNPPPDSHTPGLSKKLVAQKPDDVEQGMFYVFMLLLPMTFWDRMSANSVEYARVKGAGTDVNADKHEDDRHSRYMGKGKQRPWKLEWVSSKALLLFHATLLIMVLCKRSSVTEHFSVDPMQNSYVQQLYSRDSWFQTFRYFAPYNISSLITDELAAAFNPYAKYEDIRHTLHRNIHELTVPPKVLSFDEGGKPWQGRGGQGISVHYNSAKPNKRMSMCFMIAAFGIPFAWEFYTGEKSNVYNEELYNTQEEKGYGKTVARILRLYRSAVTGGRAEKKLEDSIVRTTGHFLFMDNLFTSLFLFFILASVYKCLATGTHRVNNNLPDLEWEGKYTRGDYKWATYVYEKVSFLYMEYGDNKMVRFLSTIHGSCELNKGKTKERWDSDSRTYSNVFLPEVKLDYDGGMGGVDLADMLESFVRIEYRTRRPYMVNYLWHFETAVYVSHRICRLLYPDAYKRRTLHDDMRALIRSIVKFSGSVRELEREESVKRRRSQHVALATDHPPGTFQRDRCAVCRDDKKKTSKGCETCEVILCSSKCWKLHHQKL